MNNFIHLHVHSDYSPQDGAQSTVQIANKAAEFNMDSVALTDHGRCGGMLHFKKSCVKAGVRPIYGLEAYVAPESRLTKSKLEDHKKTSYHLTLLAKNQEGLRNLFRLTSIGWRDGFYYKPRVDLEMLTKHSEGLVVLSGCASGRLSQYLQEGNEDWAKQHIKEMLDVWGDDFYIEVQNHGFDWEQSLKSMLFQASRDSGVPIVAAQDSHYQTREDADLHRAICRLSAGDLEFEGDDSYFKSYKDMSAMFTEEEQHAVTRTQEVADKCQCEWEYGKTIWPVYDLSDGVSPEEELRRLTLKGFADKFGEGTQEYRDRIEYELGVINKMGFPTYFLVVADFIAWAKSQRIPVGPGRGSGAGSLVCYCMGITGIDPIKYGLYFQRFLNESRVSLPDLDIDFCKRRRGEVIEYVRQKYGEDKVAQIGTYAIFKPRGSLRDFARVLGYDKRVGEELSAMVPPNVSGKTLTFDQVIKNVPEILKTNYPDVVNMARRAEKLKRQAGVHAAGVIISNQDLKTQVPLFRGKHDEITAQFDMHDVEEVGLVKFDFLGLKNLTVIQETIDLVKKHHGVDIDIDNINEDNQDVFSNIFKQGKLDGVFQFETSSGLRDLCVQVQPSSIKDLSACTSLFRPGPIGCGALDQYIKGCKGKEITYLVPKLEPILKGTYGTLIFQESVMKICTDLADYTLAEADNMRKIIGKKLPEKMKLEKTKFVTGCIKNNISETNANEMFKDIDGFSAYGFNLAHAASYSIISYQTAWLKYHYPNEFHTALLNSSFKDQDDLVKYIHACREEEIPVMPPDTNISESQFTLSNGTIIFGLAGIKGLGPKACDKLVEERNANGEFTSLQNMIDRKMNKGILKALAACGALEEITELSREQLIENLEELFKHYTKLTKWEDRNIRIAAREQEIQDWNANPIGTKPRKLPKNKEQPEMPDVGEASDLSRRDRLSLERQTLGFYLTGHPMDDYPGLSRVSQYNISKLKEGKVLNNQAINLPVVISSVTEIRTRSGKNMGVLKIEDQSGRVEATVFPRQWKKIKECIEEDAVSIVNGTVKAIMSDNDDSPSIIRVVVNKVMKVNEDSKCDTVKPVAISLKDGTRVEFITSIDTNYGKYQQSLAIINNMRRMG